MATISIHELKTQYLELAAEQAEQRGIIEVLQGKIQGLDDDLTRLKFDFESREHALDEADDIISVKECRGALARLQSEVDSVSALRTNLQRQATEARTAEIAATTKLGTIRRRIWQSRLGELLGEFGEMNADLLARIFVCGQRASPGLTGFNLRQAVGEAARLDVHPSPDSQARAAAALREPDLDF